MTCPKPGTKRYRQVLAEGCGGHQIGNPLDGYDWDCDHGYDWSCDDCPIVVDQMRREYGLVGRHKKEAVKGK
jgi:hypothetical protein